MNMSSLFAVAVLLALPGQGGCRSPEEELQGGTLVFQDRFAQAEPGSSWRVGVVEGPASKGGGPRNEADRRGHWEIRQGALTTSGERNQPLWLDVPLPDKVRVQFSARTDSDSGDIKFELFGDGRRHESGYIFVFGGWNNSKSVIARLDEHEKDRVEREDLVEPGRTYRMAVVRTSNTIYWYIDGKMYLKYRDLDPLSGEGHARMAFNSWKSRLTFHDLDIFDLGSRR
ncbi:MAG: hypothetical protein FJ125_10165 [Deltaproteobacteria bacterium]|nr:hypothetical protein [Deltaproteobacteria bacterium]